MKFYSALIVGFAFAFSSCSLQKLVDKRNAKSFAKAPYDVIIVPGYPYKAATHPELFNIRMHWAKSLYDRGITKNIIFSGAAVQTPFIEGKLMKQFADSLGIPSVNTFEENEARHSNQNLVKGKRLAKKLGFKKIAVATDPFQFSYMTLLADIYSPGMPLLTFSADSMGVFFKPLPEIK
jgi:uncharacterized SAM-binding protein YcdF (DUF218 family)